MAKAETIRARYAAGGVTMRQLADEYGVVAQNIDAVLKGRTHKPEGRHMRYVGYENAQTIRKRYAAGGVTQLQLAEEFGISKETVWHIVNGRTHLTPPDVDPAPRVEKPRRPRGRPPGRPALTETQVRAIRQRHSAGERCSELAREFAIARAAIRNVVLRHTYKRVP